MPRKKVIAGNWKMNCNLAETEDLLRALIADYEPAEGVTVIVCPPFTSLNTAACFLKDSKIELGAQNMSDHENGAYTGDVSADMLLAAGVKYVIIGHSERRRYFHEDDRLVNAKASLALQRGLIPIICIGETLKERENNQTEEVVTRQFEGALADLTVEQLKKIVVAYEPVWAIGTGKTASPEMAQEVHLLIREKLHSKEPAIAESVPVLYGGSVKPDNASGLLNQPDIDGALVGGASLKANGFIEIIKAA